MTNQNVPTEDVPVVLFGYSDVWWQENSNNLSFALVFIVFIILFMFTVISAAQTGIVYGLQSISHLTNFGYWACYEVTGILDIIILALYYLAQKIIDGRKAKI